MKTLFLLLSLALAFTAPAQPSVRNPSAGAFNTATNVAAAGGGGDIVTTLLEHYAGTDNAASTTVVDSSGNGRDGTASVNTSTLHVAGHLGTGALLLNGTDQYIAMPDSVCISLTAGTEVTLACWFKGSAIQSAIRIQPFGGSYIILGFGSSSPTCIMSNDGGAGSGVAIVGAQDGNWHHVAMTWKKNTVNGFKVYVDGAVCAQRDSANASLDVSDGDFPAIGRYNGSFPGEYTSGTLQGIYIFGRALTSTDITTLYTQTNP